VYQDGRVIVVLRCRSSSAGTSTHNLGLGFLSQVPSSLDSDVAVTGAQYDAAVDEQNALRRAIGRKLVFKAACAMVRDTVVAEVLVERALRLEDGTVTFQRPGRARYPFDVVLTAPTVSLVVRSTAARDQLRLAWFTDGAGWSAAYQAVLNRGSARITGQAQILPGRLSLDETEVQLLAGNVGRAPESRAEQLMYRKDMAARAAEAPTAAAEEQQVGEAHLYTIPGRYTIRPGVTTVASLFDPVSTTWERVYTIRGQLPWYGPIPQYGEAMPPVEVRTCSNGGSLRSGKPLPGGGWRLFEADSAGQQRLVAEASSQPRLDRISALAGPRST
jgi:hypothetical protein